jgi:preprotein translocase subunit SecA
MDEFRTWLREQIYALNGMDEMWADQLADAQHLISEAKERAYALHLPEAARAAVSGPVRQRLCEILATLPAPEYLNIQEVADLYRVSVRTIRRGLITGEIPQPETINSVQRWKRSNL